MKKAGMILCMVLLLCFGTAVSFAELRYVYTQNGMPLNMRKGATTSSEIIDYIPFGMAVEYLGETEDAQWSHISFNRKEGYVMSRYLQGGEPQEKPEAVATVAAEGSNAVENLNTVFQSMVFEDVAYQAAARPGRASGWISVYWMPTTESETVMRCYDGFALMVVAKGSGWAQVYDPISGKTGFVDVNYIR